MQTNNPAINELAQELTSGRSAFFSQPFSFSWWLRGGEPGSPSDKLTLEGDRGSVSGTYIRARFDPEHAPPNYTETFRGDVDVDRAAAILQRLFESPLFREELREETDRGMRDIQKETWTFIRGKAEYSKTLFEPFPASMEGLRTLSRKLEEQLARVKVR